MLKYDTRSVEMVPFKCLRDPILENTKMKSLCHLPPLSCTCNSGHMKSFNPTQNCTTSTFNNSSPYDELVVKILYPSSNTKHKHLIEID